ncbi:MAG: hypothetical protein ACYDA1_04780 [Vulcanimicrobiaceae bacterium]
MNKFALVLAAAMAVAPLTALAQQSPPPMNGMNGMNGMHRMSAQSMQQMEQMHAQARAKMLAALTPQNRQLLSTLAGQLAVADKPDVAAAAKQLDAALSAREKSAILDIHASMRKQMQAQMPKPPGQSMPGMPGMAGMHGMKGMQGNDPGIILLMTASMHDGPGMMHHPRKH